MQDKYMTQSGSSAYDIFDLIENPPQFRVDQNYEVVKEKIRQAVPQTKEEKALNLKMQKLNNAANKFVIDVKNQILHDRHCRCVRNIDAEDFDMAKSFQEGLKLCKVCADVALIRKCVNSSKDFNIVKTIFRKMKAETQDLQWLCNCKLVQMKAISPHVVELRVNEDVWRIEISDDGKYRTLLHNNYRIIGTKRIMGKGFHTHFERKPARFHEIAKAMIKYDTEFHIRQRIENPPVDVMELAPENDIYVVDLQELFSIPTVIRLKKIKLFYHRYLYIDNVENFGEKVFKERGIKAKIISKAASDEFGYAVVICDIPKWQREKVFSAMTKIKALMWRKGYKSAYVCIQATIKYLDKNKIRYARRIGRRK